MTRYFSFLVLLAVIVLLAILLYRVMAGFLVPIFLAAILVVIFRPSHAWVLEKVGGRQQVAAGVTTAGILLLVLIPLTLLVLFGVFEGREAMKKFGTGSIVDKVNQARESLGLEIPASMELHEVELRVEKLASEFDRNQLPYQLDEVKRLQKSLAILGQELELPNPSPQDDESQPSGALVRNWQGILKEVNETRGLLDGVDAPKNVSDSDGISVADEVEPKLKSIEKRFKQFRTSLLGGSFWAKVKMMANPSDEELVLYEESIATFVREKLIAFGGATTAFLARLLLGIAIMTVSLYFFLLDGPRMLKTLKGLSPIDDEHEDELILEFSRVSRAVVVATLLSAIAQGFLAGIGFYFVGMESVFLLTLLTTCLALVPFAGAAAVWVPVCLWLYFVDGNFWGALILAIYGTTIVSMADNFIKPYVLHGQSNLHPLLALLSVLGGVAALGPIGVLVGPMVVTFLQTLLNILRRELSTMETINGDNPRTKQTEEQVNSASRWASMSHSTP